VILGNPTLKAEQIMLGVKSPHLFQIVGLVEGGRHLSFQNIGSQCDTGQARGERRFFRLQPFDFSFGLVETYFRQGQGRGSRNVDGPFQGNGIKQYPRLFRNNPGKNIIGNN